MVYPGFWYMIVNDDVYEYLYAEIYYDNEIVALINQEKGKENLEIEIFSPEDKSKRVFELQKFESILHRAREDLVNG